MDCRRIDRIISRDAPRIIVQVFVWVAIVIAMVHAAVAMAQPPRMGSAEVLHKAMEYQVQFRAGKLAVVPEYVGMLEAATKADPDQADLWYAMGRAYLMQAARSMFPGGNPADAMQIMPRGIAALERALRIDPDHPRALAQLGAVQAALAVQMNEPARAGKAVADMNRAVQLAPQSTMVRLSRGFLGPNLPDHLRDSVAEAEDLDFIIDGAGFSRAADYVRIMRGDLDFEMGKPAQARLHYEIAAEAGSRAATQARARLAALDSGGVAMTDIRKLRAAAGAHCTLCHGP